jgi:hypothetical protein
VDAWVKVVGKDYATWRAECGVGDTGFAVERVWTRNNSDGTPLNPLSAKARDAVGE